MYLLYINLDLSTNSFLWFGKNNPSCYILCSIFYFAFNHSMKYTFNQKSSIYFVNVLGFFVNHIFLWHLRMTIPKFWKVIFFLWSSIFWGIKIVFMGDDSTQRKGNKRDTSLLIRLQKFTERIDYLGSTYPQIEERNFFYHSTTMLFIHLCHWYYINSWMSVLNSVLKIKKKMMGV